MISHTNKFVYVHIPKVAGSSINDTLRDQNFNSENLTPIPMEPENIFFDPPPPHFSIADYYKYGFLNQEQYNSYFKFTFVRNPWDRIVSEYKYRGHAKRFSFKNFIFHHLPVPSWSDLYCHIIPQYNFIYIQDKLEVDFVGKFENIQSDFDKLCIKLDLPGRKLQHSNKSLSLIKGKKSIFEMLRALKNIINIEQRRNTFSHYTKYYDNETIEFVAQLYKNDIRAFGYDFGE